MQLCKKNKKIYVFVAHNAPSGHEIYCIKVIFKVTNLGVIWKNLGEG